jgi:uncharacterized protein (TIGR02453 family)
MAYFTNKFTEFFKGLAANNNRDWFWDNKPTYEQEVKKPFYALVQDLIDVHNKRDKSFNLEVKNAVFRINRDIRFSKDKSPYKLHVGAVISPAGRKDLQYPGTYIHFSASEHWIGGGSYGPDRTTIQNIRSAIVKDYDQVKKIISASKFKKYFKGEIKGDRNKILPKEFKSAGVDIPLLFNKQFYYMAQYEDEALVLRDDLLDFIIEHENAGKKWNEFILAAKS